MNLTPREGLTNEHVYAIAIDADRHLWLGEKGGSMSGYRECRGE
ncbi:MAG: hypothetical protein MPW14_08175 [Candidatus Manganitrophus sp.]|nr:hypothetical protein [Candidatus Manganitrophus sp.]WDT71037.1 MAG: hypothetical protein MPW17_20200 [Candidatus Manganitrophus sp.]WDT81683.1 MAG: hypothetical protein MPW14_08175 [Candidatus Manganitrophus sp.]